MEQGPNNQVFLLFAFGTAGMLILSFAIVLFVTFYQKRMVQEQLKQQKLEGEFQQKIIEATLDSQESERKRVAADLHDSIGGMLSAIRLGLSTAGVEMRDPTRLDASKQMLDDTIDSVRRISRELMPATLEKFGLATSLRELTQKLQSTTNIEIGMIEVGQTRPTDQRRELMVYRIVQELLNNAIKHAKASFIEVVLRYSDRIEVIVEDNGIGIDPQQLESSGRKSLGLFNIQSRVKLLGAVVKIDKEKTGGSRIVVTVPYA